MGSGHFQRDNLWKQGQRSVFCIGGANKQVQETLTCMGFGGNSLPENFEILKLGNATFSILNEISKNEMTDV